MGWEGVEAGGLLRAAWPWPSGRGRWGQRLHPVPGLLSGGSLRRSRVLRAAMLKGAPLRPLLLRGRGLRGVRGEGGRGRGGGRLGRRCRRRS